jgi:hypothetical protein
MIAADRSTAGKEDAMMYSTRIYRKTTTKPIPPGATIQTAKVSRVAVWQNARGRTCKAPLNTGGDRIV